MATSTEPTQRIAGQKRTDSIHESQITTRIPSRPLRDPSISASAERMPGRLRPVSSQTIHETVIPDKQKSAGFDTMRKMSPVEVTTAMVHFYRGEVQRSNTWRTRLDNTTYWAVLTVGGALSFAFSSPNNPHFLIPIISILVAIFLLMEARRYRYYEIWASRVRVIETGYFAQMLSPDGVPRDQEWASHLASDLLTPHFTISVWEAIGRRLRRNYIWLFALLAASWNLKVYLHPQPALSFDEFIRRAQVGLVPGGFVFFIGFVFNFVLAAFAVGTIKLREATGEVLPRHEFSLRPLARVTSWTRAAATSVPRATVRRAKRARQRLRGTTGEHKKIDLTQSPDRRIHVSETANRPRSKQ
jgi:uncharacterized membrane protein